MHPLRIIVAASAALGTVFLAGEAGAYRPFDSTDADVAARGEFELELGPIGYLRAGRARYLAASAVVANLGLIDRVEAVLQARELVLLESGAHGSLVDTGALLKIILRKGSLQGSSGLSVATEVGLLLPTINGESGVGESAALILSQRWSFATVHLNFEVSQTRTGNADAFVGAIVEGPDEWVARPVAEFFCEDELNADQTISGLVGFIARVNDRLSLDWGTRAARVGETKVFEARAGLTWAFPMWGRQ